MKVVHFKKTFLHPTETFIFNQIKNLNGVENFVLCRKKNENSNFNFSEIRKIDEIPHSINWQFQKFVFATACVLGKYYRFDQRKMIERLRAYQPDLMHAHFGPDANYILPVAIKLNIPIITSFYGYDVSAFPKSYWGLAKRAYRQLIRNGDVFLAMSENMKQELIKLSFPSEKIVVHHFGVDFKYFDLGNRNYSMADDGSFYLIQIASMIPKKGHIYLLQAINQLVNKMNRKNIVLNLIGNGPLEKNLRQFVTEHNLENNVRFLGFVPISNDYLNLLANSHAYVHPSVTDKFGAKEGIPTTLLEAMASGLPPISSFHAGIPDVISHEKNGFLIPEKDIDKLVEYICRLADRENLRVDLGQKAKQTILINYNIYKQSERLQKIYRSIIQS